MLKIKRSKLKQLAQNKLGNDSIESQNKILVMISTSLAARTSYTIVGDEKEINYQKMIELHDRLIAQNPPHSSPMEHCARAMSDEEYDTFVKGQIPSTIKGGSYKGLTSIPSEAKGWCRNFKGFIQYRHIVETEMTN